MTEAQYLAILHADFERKFRALIPAIPSTATFTFVQGEDVIYAVIFDGQHASQLWTFSPGDDERNTYWSPASPYPAPLNEHGTLHIALDDATVEAGHKFSDTL